ncbi:MAG TPA: wax ester/triacylglycerol synthase domain-containing protein, partial [Solimonas sp.]
MQQLSPLDALFVYNETRNAPLHISPLMFYDVGTAPGGFVRFKDILQTFRSRLQRSPVFRRRLLTVPGNLGYPYWIEDEDFDLEFHVRHLALPKPGDWRQFCILISRLHGRPLDMSRPPWEAYIIEGLDNIPGLPPGSFAMYMKIHHSAIDGATGNQIIEALHDLQPDAPPVNTPDLWQPEPAPSPATLARRALRDLRRQPRQAVELGRQILRARSRVRVGFDGQPFASHDVNEPLRFNSEVTPHRVFGGLHVELTQLKAIKDCVPGATLNDAVLALVGGAM